MFLWSYVDAKDEILWPVAVKSHNFTGILAYPYISMTQGVALSSQLEQAILQD